MNDGRDKLIDDLEIVIENAARGVMEILPYVEKSVDQNWNDARQQLLEIERRVDALREAMAMDICRIAAKCGVLVSHKSPNASFDRQPQNQPIPQYRDRSFEPYVAADNEGWQDELHEAVSMPRVVTGGRR